VKRHEDIERKATSAHWNVADRALEDTELSHMTDADLP